MKYYLSSLSSLLLFCILTANAQNFPLDSTTKKINYTDIVPADSLTSAQLYKNTTEWMGKNFKPETNYDTQFNLLEGYVKCSASQMVYTKGMMSKEIHGRITYDVSVDIKNHKYRYTFTNFIFEYYKQNRQYKYEPTGRKKPLEEPKYPGWQTVWNKHRINTHNTVLKYIESLKSAMLKVETKVSDLPQKKKAEW